MSEQDPCGWEREPQFDGDDGFLTGCGNMQVFMAGDWRDNSYKFCPYCGGKIIEVGEALPRSELIEITTGEQ